MTMSGHRIVELIWSGNLSGFPRTLSCQTEAVASRAGLQCWEAEGFSLALRKEMVFLLSGCLSFWMDVVAGSLSTR